MVRHVGEIETPMSVARFWGKRASYMTHASKEVQQVGFRVPDPSNEQGWKEIVLEMKHGDMMTFDDRWCHRGMDACHGANAFSLHGYAGLATDSAQDHFGGKCHPWIVDNGTVSPGRRV